MKKTLAFSIVVAAMVASCKKTDTAAAVTLSASATQVAVGQEVTVTVSNGSASRWSVTPATHATQVSSSSTQGKYTFAADGTYTISVHTTDSTRHHGCHAGVDSAAVKIVVGAGI